MSHPEQERIQKAPKQASKTQLPPEGEAVSVEVKRKVEKQRYLTDVRDRLKKHLGYERKNLRRNQIQSIEKLIAFVEAGKTHGLIKQPTGAGKTRLFCEMLAAINETSLVLVPRVNLMEDVRDALVGDAERDLEGVGYLNEDVLLVKEEANETAVSSINRILANMQEGNVVVMTYQSFLSVAKKDPELLRMFLEKIKVTISDEAHRSLGKQTQEAVENHIDSNPENIQDEVNEEVEMILENTESEALTVEEEQDQNEAQAFIDKEFERLHLRFTATPQLGKKNVQDTYDIEIIDSVRYQEMVEDGTCILPKIASVGRAVYHLHEDVPVNNRLLEELAAEGRFRMQDGRTVEETVTTNYLEQKEKHGDYLPAVAYCETIAQAERYTQYLKSLGVRAVRCTSANGEHDEGADARDVQKWFHEDALDVVVTVKKVAEGWDVPTLRCAIWCTFTNSPADLLQRNGRISRSLSEDSVHPAKSSENTMIIEPEWVVVSKYASGDGNGEVRTGNGTKRDNTTLYIAPNYYERLVELGEFDKDAVLSSFPDARINVYEEAPEGWKTANFLAGEFGRDFNKWKIVAEQYRTEHPEWFKMYKTHSHIVEHYSPELVTLLVKELVVEKAPEGWKTVNTLRMEFRRNYELWKQSAETYREKHPEWFHDYKAAGQTKEHYSPELIALLVTELVVEKAPAGWKTANALSEEFGKNEKTWKKVAEQYRAEHPEWFKNYKTGGKDVEYYTPELIEKLVKELITEKVPNGWEIMEPIIIKYKIGYKTFKKEVEKYREEHPEWFKMYRISSGHIVEHYAPEFITLLAESMERKAPEGWKSNPDLAKEFGCSETTCKKFAEQHREEHPEWFKIYRTSLGHIVEHYAPELITLLIPKVVAEKAPEGWKSPAALARTLGGGEPKWKAEAKKYRIEHPEWFKDYKPSSGPVCEHYSPELIAKLRKDLGKE